MSLFGSFSATIVLAFGFLANSLPASAQTPEANVVRLDIMKLKEAASFMVNGKSVRGSLLDVLRFGQPNGATVLNVFFHSNTATIRDVEEVQATADKQGGFAEIHTFFRCYSLNRAAWCELTIGKPIVEVRE
jgi:hypothetical protein